MFCMKENSDIINNKKESREKKFGVQTFSAKSVGLVSKTGGTGFSRSE